MKRDPRLHSLSTDHHHALVLARRCARGELDAAAARAAYERELAPHFAIEERLLLPALEAAGERAAADRTRAEHATLRAHLDAGRLADFASLLEAHVRFEERELFELAQARLGEDALRAIAAACEASGSGTPPTRSTP
jgi:hypothetical protein